MLGREEQAAVVDERHLEHRNALLQQALDALRAATTGPGIRDDERIEALRLASATERELQRVSVHTTADLLRRGAFAERRQRPETALADLLGIERADARRIVTAAEQVCPLIDLHGQARPPTLPATAVPLPCLSLIAFATASQTSALREEITTLAPCSAMRSAMARPMPRVEPVMTATFPFISNRLMWSSRIVFRFQT